MATMDGSVSADSWGEDDGYCHRPSFSTYAIIHRGGMQFAPLRLLNNPPPHPPPFFPLLPFPSAVPSSSHGLLLFRNLATTSYFVYNPFAHSSTTARRLIPDPEHPHSLDTPAVLSVIYPGSVSDFLIICLRSQLIAHPDSDRQLPEHLRQSYMLDTFYSLTNEWRGTSCMLDHPVRIDPNTGVAIGKKAYWLTETPIRLARFNVGTDGITVGDVLDVPSGIRRQLGRVRDALCCVCVDESCLALHVLGNDDRWRLEHRVPMRVSEGAEFRYDGESISCGAMPVPARFQSYKLEVVLWVDRGLVVWENRCFWDGSCGEWQEDREYQMNLVPGCDGLVMDWIVHSVPIVAETSSAPISYLVR